MASQLTPTAFDNALKIIYPDGFEVVWYPKAKFLSLAKNTYDFEGSSKQINPLYQGIEGSTTFADAVEAMSTPGIAKFLVTRKKDYVLGSIDNEAIEASKSKRGAVAQALKTQMDSALYAFGRSAAFQTWGDGTGTRGTVDAYAAGVITLTDVNDSVKFETGMKLQKKTSGGVLLAGYLTITAINRSTGELTVTLHDGAADPAATNTLARKGDYTASGSNCLNGILSWIPVTAPVAGSDSFFGQDRGVDVNRLAGSRWTGTGTIEESVIDAEAEGNTHGGEFDTLILHSKRMAELRRSVQGQAWYARQNVSSNGGQSGKVKISYSGFTFEGENGPIQVVGDPNAPYAYGLLTKIGDWELSSTPSGAPHFHEQAGSKLLTSVGSDGMDFRLKVYWNLICHRPINNVLITW